MSEYQGGYAVAANEPSSGEQSVVAQAQEKVHEKAQHATGVATQKVRQQVETGAGRASDELHAIAQAMHRTGHALHAEGRSSARVVDGATERIDRFAAYLGNTQGDAMLRDVESFGRRQPWAMIGVGLAMGFVASRFLKASSRNRYDEFSRPAPAPAPPAATVPPVADAGRETAVTTPPVAPPVPTGYGSGEWR